MQHNLRIAGHEFSQHGRNRGEVAVVRAGAAEIGKRNLFATLARAGVGALGAPHHLVADGVALDKGRLAMLLRRLGKIVRGRENAITFTERAGYLSHVVAKTARGFR